MYIVQYTNRAVQYTNRAVQYTNRGVQYTNRDFPIIRAFYQPAVKDGIYVYSIFKCTKYELHVRSSMYTVLYVVYIQ